MTYKEMIELAQERGRGSESMMHDSVDHISDMLCTVKKHDPEAYWRFMREQHGILYGCHYSPEFADWDVERMHSTDKDGREHHGAHWTKDEVTAATSTFIFPSGTTECDKYVAFNSTWHDMHKKFADETILEIAELFWFSDEDWEGSSKVWEYYSVKH